MVAVIECPLMNIICAKPMHPCMVWALATCEWYKFHLSSTVWPQRFIWALLPCNGKTQLKHFHIHRVFWSTVLLDLCLWTSLCCSCSGLIARSLDEYPFLGLNLLRLLAENRIAEFHTELELLPQEALNHPCIKYAVELEQCFTEGTYNQLANAFHAVPNETYVYLMDRLAESVRYKFA